MEDAHMADDGNIPRQHDGLLKAGVALTPLYDQALNFARILHAAQRRKSNGAPYLSHLLQVSGLVLEYGGDESQAIAALLHDAIEDQATAFGGAALLRDIMGSRFGPTVLRLVDLCSDCDGAPKPPWLWRKQRHQQRLAGASAYECLVPACNNLHNLRCINADLRAGRDPFRLLIAGPEDKLRHLSALLEVFDANLLPVAAELRHELTQLRRLLIEGHICWQDQEMYSAAYATP